MKRVTATIWVCPRCFSWYGSSAAPDLAHTPQPIAHGKLSDTRTRAICPSPGCSQMGVNRVPHNVLLNVEELVEVQSGEAD